MSIEAQEIRLKIVDHQFLYSLKTSETIPCKPHDIEKIRIIIMVPLKQWVADKLFRIFLGGKHSSHTRMPISAGRYDEILIIEKVICFIYVHSFIDFLNRR